MGQALIGVTRSSSSGTSESLAAFYLPDSPLFYFRGTLGLNCYVTWTLVHYEKNTTVFGNCLEWQRLK